MDSFYGKTILITGASSGIGRRTALDFAKLGANVILTARREDLLESLVQEIKKKNVRVERFACDLSESKSRENLIALIRSSGLLPDILINNAGYGNYRPFLQETSVEITRMMEVNYTAAAHLMSAFTPAMIEKGYGAVVNIASGAGRVAVPNMAIYCATKFALHALTESFAYEMAGTGVTVHLINPGPVDTEFFRAGKWETEPPRCKASPEQVSTAIQQAILRNRLITSVPSKRGMMVYAFHLFGPFGRWIVKRKFSNRIR